MKIPIGSLWWWRDANKEVVYTDITYKILNNTGAFVIIGFGKGQKTKYLKDHFKNGWMVPATMENE